MRHRRHKKRLRRRLVLALQIGVLALLVGLLVYGLVRTSQKNAQLKLRAENATVQPEQLTIQWNGQRYVENPHIKSILLIGTDNDGKSTPAQCDFLTIAVVDEKQETWKLLQLNRDTMCNMSVLSARGKTVGSIYQQLALAHSYGSGGWDSCRNTVYAVQNLLYGIQLDAFMRIPISAVSQLNDAVGGVTVTLEDDFSASDTSMTPGTELTLTGKQAEIFVRSRLQMADPTNLARMERQKTYLINWFHTASEMMQKHADTTALSILEPISKDIFSNLTIYRLASFVESAATYPEPEIITVPGVSSIGEKYAEYRVDEDALQQIVIELFFKPEKE